MTFQVVTVTWDETDPALSAQSGTVTFQLTAPLIDTSGQTADLEPKTYVFANGTGTSDPLAANDSAGALPAGTAYKVTIAAAGQAPRSFTAQLLHANGASQTLGYLEANAAVPAVQYAQFMPLPLGTPTAGQVPAFTGTGFATTPVSVTGEPVLSDAATVYVNANRGNDGNDGLTWATAFATIQKGINSLPTVNGQQVGVVEFGFGTYAPVTISDTQSPVIRGRGSGQSYDNYDNITLPAHTSIIACTGTGNGVTITGPGTFSPSGGPVPSHVVIEDCAIIGNASATYGVSVTNTERFQMHRVVIDQFGTAGYYVTNTYWFELDWVTITNCGKVDASTPTAGVYIDVPDGNHAVNLGLFKNCIFNENVGYGVYNTGGIVLNFLNTDFSHTAASAVSGSGSGIYCGAGSGPVTFKGCWFESNENYGADTGAEGGPFAYIGCIFSGGNYQQYGTNTGYTQYYTGCSFARHASGYSIDNRNGNCLNWAACSTSDGTFVRGVDGGNYPNQDIPANMALAFGTTYSSYIGSYGARSVSGSITIHTNLGNSLNLFLTGNVTAAAFDENTAGQTLTIAWIQPPSGGPYSYTWPSNCKFANGTPPAQSTGANYEDNVTFKCNGTDWREIGRGPAVH